MSMTEHRGNSHGRPMPAMPEPRVPQPPASIPLHPVVQEHIVAWNEMAAENERLKATLQRATNDLEVQREVNQRLEFLLEDERKRVAEFDKLKDKYLRFAQEILTNLQGGKALFEAAIERAMDAAHNHQPAEQEPTALENKFAAAVADAVAMKEDGQGGA